MRNNKFLVFVKFAGDCVNNIVKWHHRRSNEKNTTLTVLLCGEGGLVQCLEQVFLFGFRSSRLFGRNLYLWDFFSKQFT